jgi:hypothetical protein
MKYLIFALCIMMLAIPASAQTISYSCPQGMAVYTLNMVGNSPTTATFELYRQDGTITSGSWSYQPYSVLGYSIANIVTITLEGDSKNLVFVTPGQIHISMQPGRNLTEIAETRWIMGAGQSGSVNNIAVEQDGISSPIIGFKIVSDNDITYTETEDTIDTITKNLQSDSMLSTLAKIKEFIESTFWIAYDFVTSLLYWLKYFFVDNLTMIVALFLAVPMAFAAKNSRGNPEKFFRQYFRTLRGFFEFILMLWGKLIESIGTIRGWFRI